jgi:hypothetical protein
MPYQEALGCIITILLVCFQSKFRPTGVRSFNVPCVEGSQNSLRDYKGNERIHYEGIQGHNNRGCHQWNRSTLYNGAVNEPVI